jgi:hypothetical protein
MAAGEDAENSLTLALQRADTPGGTWWVPNPILLLLRRGFLRPCEIVFLAHPVQEGQNRDEQTSRKTPVITGPGCAGHRVAGSRHGMGTPTPRFARCAALCRTASAPRGTDVGRTGWERAGQAASDSSFDISRGWDVSVGRDEFLAATTLVPVVDGVAGEGRQALVVAWRLRGVISTR